ncbi:MAG: hypothetical protein JXQ73_14310 [Phycisphaerae bacterium]|nr:hypothetical protein [Phycisphaerae bacterium]
MHPTQELIEQLRRGKIDAAKRMTPEQRLLAGGDLFDAMVERIVAGIRAQHPDATDEEVRAMLGERLAVARRTENHT